MPGFLKTYADAAAATEALRRSDALGLAGVPTPTAQPLPQVGVLKFDLIEGPSGAEILSTDLVDLLCPLVQLQDARLSRLPLYDPLLRIRPRLSLATSQAIRRVVDEVVPQGTALVHGDFHVGQLIRDAGGKVWIIDLDDLAIGPPEADLANFVANIATSGKRDFIATVTDFSADCTRAWRALGRHSNPDTFDAFLRFALVRRHLKLRQAGRPDFEAPISGFLGNAACRIFPSGSAAYHG